MLTRFGKRVGMAVAVIAEYAERHFGCSLDCPRTVTGIFWLSGSCRRLECSVVDKQQL